MPKPIIVGGHIDEKFRQAMADRLNGVVHVESSDEDYTAPLSDVLAQFDEQEAIIAALAATGVYTSEDAAHGITFTIRKAPEPNSPCYDVYKDGVKHQTFTSHAAAKAYVDHVTKE